MGCTHEWGQLLSRRVDGETTPEENARLDEHLAGCPTCRDLLALFQRNESVLDNALTGEVFGSQMVEEVMAEIRREDAPMVIAPEVKASAAGRAWERLAPWFGPAAAAAAVLIAVLALVLPRGREADLRAQLDDIRRQNESLSRSLKRSNDIASQVSMQLADRYAEQTRAWMNEKSAEVVSEQRPFGRVEPGRAIEIWTHVRDLSIFDSFDLQRSESGRSEWIDVARGLKRPSFEDVKATPGVLYDYRFIGHRKDGSTDAPMPPVVGLSLDLGAVSDPARQIEVWFDFATPNRDQATFRLVRTIDGRKVSYVVTARPGGAIGERAEIDGREIDFTTGLVLERLEESEQPFTFKCGDSVLRFSRQNVRADLKSPTGADRPIGVFRGEWTWVPAPR